MTFTSDVSKAVLIFSEQISTMEVSGSLVLKKRVTGPTNLRVAFPVDSVNPLANVNMARVERSARLFIGVSFE